MDHPSRIKSNRIPDYTRTLPRPHPCQRLDRTVGRQEDRDQRHHSGHEDTEDNDTKLIGYDVE